jgi:hypothetical protein
MTGAKVHEIFGNYLKQNQGTLVNGQDWITSFQTSDVFKVLEKVSSDMRTPGKVSLRIPDGGQDTTSIVVHSEKEFDKGSSLIHFSLDAAATPEFLMTPHVQRGVSLATFVKRFGHALGPRTLSLLKAMGYSMTEKTRRKSSLLSCILPNRM